MRQIRVQSDGMGRDTRVTLPDGEQLTPVEADIFIQWNEPNKVNLTFIASKIDVHADHNETTVICPLCQGKSTHYCPEGRTL